MDRAASGDRGAEPHEFINDLVRTYNRGVYSFAKRVLGDEERALEATQETFVRAFKYRDSFDPAKGSVRAWLFAIAANRIREARRSAREAPTPLGEDAGALASSSEEGLEAFARGALREEVTRALEELPVDFREVLTLRYVSDLSMEEVAKVLGLSLSAAKMRALRGRDLLARRLAKLMKGSGES